MVSGSRPVRCSTMRFGWWNRGGTSIQPPVPKIRAAPGVGLRSDIRIDADRPSA